VTVAARSMVAPDIRCAGHFSTHDPEGEAREYVMTGLGRPHRTWMCAGCREKARMIGITLRPVGPAYPGALATDFAGDETSPPLDRLRRFLRGPR
jgi:hypothetical protein